MKNLLILFVASIVYTLGFATGNYLGVNPIVTGVGAVVASALPNAPKGALRAGIDITDLSALLSQYVKVPQNAAAIWYRVVGELELVKYARKISGQTGKYSPLTSSNTELLQAFQKAFTPKGTVSFTPYVSDVFRVKVDYLLDNIDEIVDGYAQFLYDESKERKDWPIVKYIVERHLIPGIVKDLNTALCSGVYVAPTAGVAGSAAGSMNGALTIISNEITATNLTPIVTGATTAANAIDNVNTFMAGVAATNEDDANAAGTLFVSKAVERFYKQDRLDTYGLTANLDSRNLLNLDLFPNTNIVGLEGMGTSQRMWFTPTGPKGNLLYLYDKIFLPKSFEVQVEKRDVIMMTDFHAATGFHTLERLYVNDQS